MQQGDTTNSSSTTSSQTLGANDRLKHLVEKIFNGVTLEIENGAFNLQGSLWSYLENQVVITARKEIGPNRPDKDATRSIISRLALALPKDHQVSTI